MAQLLILAKRYDTGESVRVQVRDGVIASVSPAAGELAQPAASEFALSQGEGLRFLQAEFVAPGFCDIQVNGALGHNLTSSELTVEQVRAISEECLRHGTTSYCPTVITSDTATLCQALRVLARAVETDELVRDLVVGFHLEGPYISPEPGPRGAHPAAHVRPPDRDEFCRLQEAADGRIRIVTLSPTWPHAAEFIGWLHAQGIVVALGHHNASAQQIAQAVQAGARLCTHLGNGCDLMLPRHPNYLWEQLANDALWASLICDGHHLPSSVIKCFLRCKTPRRCILVSDASPLAGLPPGRYPLWGKVIELLPNGRTEVRDERGQTVLAGASAFLDTGVLRAWQDGEVALSEAVEMASVRPRCLLGLNQTFLQPGDSANLVLFDVAETRLQIRHTVLGTRVI